MSAPLYFLPGIRLSGFAPDRGKLSRSLLAARGLAEAWSDVEQLDDVAYCEITGRGPDGGPGLVVSALPVAGREPPRRVGYYPDETAIRWTLAREGLWLAVDDHFPVAPSDVARRKQFPGHPVELADGQEWIVPVVRRGLKKGVPALPERMGWDAHGQFGMVLDPRYGVLWERTEKLMEYFGTGEHSMSYADAAELDLDFLGLNYRIGKVEATALGLLDTTNWEKILWAALDGPTIDKAMAAVEAAKKNGVAPPSPPSSTSGTPGGADFCPDTTPAEASCTSPQP
jgi:hypothetical protein